MRHRCFSTTRVATSARLRTFLLGYIFHLLTFKPYAPVHMRVHHHTKHPPSSFLSDIQTYHLHDSFSFSSLWFIDVTVSPIHNTSTPYSSSCHCIQPNLFLHLTSLIRALTRDVNYCQHLFSCPPSRLF